MKNLTTFLTIIFYLLFSLSCSNSANNTPEIPKNKKVIRLQQQWFANSGFAGELFAKYNTADKYGFQLEVIPGSDQIDTKQVVKLGEAEFGVAGAEQIMQANEKGANLVVIGVINYKSLACFISKKGKGIMKPKDFEGRKIGTMEGSPVDLIYQALKKKENLKIEKNAEIPTGWVLTGFMQDQYDIYPAFINDEPITLKLQGIDVDTIEPSNYGVDFIGTVYFCKKEMIDCCSSDVQNFVNAIAEGWELSIKDPKQAIDYLKKYDGNIDEKKELESMVKGIDYYKGEHGMTLYSKEETWNKMASVLKDIGVLKSFDYSSSVDNKFIGWYHDKVKNQ